MQRMVKNVVKVGYTINGEAKEKLVVAKTDAEAFAAVIEEVGHVPADLTAEHLGAKIAVVEDEDFYRMATFKDCKITD